MYHPITIVLAIRISDHLGILDNKLLLILFATTLSVIIAGISYRFMEKYFISRKTKYSNIISGETPKKRIKIW